MVGEKAGTVVIMGPPAPGPGVSCRSKVSTKVGTGVDTVGAVKGSRVGRNVFL